MIIVLGLLLTIFSGTTHEQFKAGSKHTYFAMACPESKMPTAETDCGHGGHSANQSGANSRALKACGFVYNDCVLVKEGNVNVYQTKIDEADKKKTEDKKVEIASMIDRAKKTCKDLGFQEGTSKFADCSLKLYSQSVELAAEKKQTVVMQPQSSGSNTMTIYDPVRDANALIKQGQRMMSGACTLGIDC